MRRGGRKGETTGKRQGKKTIRQRLSVECVHSVFIFQG